MSDAKKRLDPARATNYCEKVWTESCVPTLQEYIAIPNKSPSFDSKWKEHGYMDKVVEMFVAWAKDHSPPDMKIQVISEEGRTPLIYMEIPGASDDTVLLYGHLDKQPEMSGWSEDLGPWKPVLKGDKLYGRGGADDGYAMFAALSAINLLHDQGVPHARCVILIEASEESGSYDLPHYINSLGDEIGTPSLVVCLDSGCGNYDQMWSTTSLRGIITGVLRVELISEGVHSGDGSGIIASSFRVLRQLLSRLEDENTGEILPKDFHQEIPAQRLEQAKACSEILGTDVYSKFPLHEGTKPVTENLTELILNRTWRPALSITGIEGLPKIEDGGNVLRPVTAAKLSLRLPPSVDADSVMEKLRTLLESNPPYGAKVTIEDLEGANGWNAPELADWLGDTLQDASNAYFGKEAAYMGEGGSIPFMGMLGEKFPKAQFVITGVLGPHSNAHGPNEFLHIPTAKRLTACVAHILQDHYWKHVE